MQSPFLGILYPKLRKFPPNSLMHYWHSSSAFSLFSADYCCQIHDLSTLPDDPPGCLLFPSNHRITIACQLLSSTFSPVKQNISTFGNSGQVLTSAVELRPCFAPAMSTFCALKREMTRGPLLENSHRKLCLVLIKLVLYFLLFTGIIYPLLCSITFHFPVCFN